MTSEEKKIIIEQNWIGDNMNYRALEDLIGILIKKSGYKITDLRVLEDTDYLTSRKIIYQKKQII